MSADRSQRSTFEVGQLPGDGHPLAPLVLSVETMLTLAVAFTLLALGVESFWVVFVVGFGGVVPVSVGLLATLDRRDTQRAGSRDRQSEPTDSALAELRMRYAAGEFTEAEFERRVERLLETADAETTADRPRDQRTEPERSTATRRR